MKLLQQPEWHRTRDQFDFFDDFMVLDTTYWTILEADSGAESDIDADGQGGLHTLTTGATDNNEAAIESAESFLINASRPIMIEARLKYTEANTDDANVAFGLTEAPGPNLILDDSAGFKTTADGAAIYKIDGETTWRTISSNATTQTKTISSNTAGGGSYEVLTIKIEPFSTSKALVTYCVDGEQLRSSTASAGQPNISDEVAISGMEELALFVYVKAGSGNSEVVTIDYVGASQLR